MIMRVLVSSALATAIAASIGTAAVYAKEPGSYRTGAQRLRHEGTTRFASHSHPLSGPPYLNVWGSHVYSDRPSASQPYINVWGSRVYLDRP